MKPLFRSPWAPLILLSGLLVWIIYSLVTTDSAGGWAVRSYSIWGDWSAHLSFITAFRERGLGWILGSNPLFSGAPFQYPFLSHWLTAALAGLLRMDSIPVMIYTGILLLASLPFLIFFFYRSFGIAVRASLASTVGWLFLGGLQIFDTSLRPDRALTNQFEAGSVFTSFLLFELIPQRAFLFGLVTLLSAFLLLLRSGSRIALSLGISLLMILPLLHFHTWIAAGALLISLAVFPGPGPVLAHRRSVLRTGAWIAGVSGTLVALILLRHSDYRLTWDFWSPGWAQNPDTRLTRAQDMNPVWFWIYNTGAFIPLVISGILLSRRERAIRALGLAGLVLFGAALLFRFQPYFYDNLKIITYSFLFLAPFFGIALEALSRRLLPVAALLLLLQCASAVRDARFLTSGGESTSWFSAREISLAGRFKELRASSSDLVLTSSSHHHWTPCLAGNPVFMGYPGWLWSWGIAYSYREKELFEIWTGRPMALDLIRTHGIRYIIFERGETVLSHPPNEEFFKKHFKKILDEGGWAVYSVETRSPS
jgi:hypothetical protein